MWVSDLLASILNAYRGYYELLSTLCQYYTDHISKDCWGQVTPKGEGEKTLMGNVVGKDGRFKGLVGWILALDVFSDLPLHELAVQSDRAQSLKPESDFHREKTMKDLSRRAYYFTVRTETSNWDVTVVTLQRKPLNFGGWWKCHFN